VTVADRAQTIMSTILPMIGTWVGTVLAFYFAKENFEVAQRASERLLAGRSDRLAMEIAISENQIKAFSVKSDWKPDDTRLLEIRNCLNTIGKYRVPIIDDTKLVRFVIHRQPLDTFIADLAKPDDKNTATLQSLLDSAQGKQIKNSVAFISERATIAEAKAAMESRPGCQDVFITKTASPTDAILAWVTNNELQKALSAQ
jgi:hypothetical protein